MDSARRYGSNFTKAANALNKRVLIGIPMTGLIRSEWHLSFMGQIIPCNWSHGTAVHIFPNYSPLGFLVAEARNLIVKKFIEGGFEWLLFIDHDVLLPNNTLLKFNKYMRDKKYPIVGGLYFAKGLPAEPLVYRGRGNSYFKKWKLGDKVFVDGMGLGCHLIHQSILKILYDESPEYQIEKNVTARAVFHTPAESEFDPDIGLMSYRGTEDLPFYERIIKDKVLERAGWKTRKYPFLCDTSIFCKHIDFNGVQFPTQNEENEFK